MLDVVYGTVSDNSSSDNVHMRTLSIGNAEMAELHVSWPALVTTCATAAAVYY